jgi:hypothetical protein
LKTLEVKAERNKFEFSKNKVRKDPIPYEKTIKSDKDKHKERKWDWREFEIEEDDFK